MFICNSRAAGVIPPKADMNVEIPTMLRCGIVSEFTFTVKDISIIFLSRKNDK